MKAISKKHDCEKKVTVSQSEHESSLSLTDLSRIQSLTGKEKKRKECRALLYVCRSEQKNRTDG